jgi:hypothetical protein
MIGDWDAGLVVARALSDGSGMGAVGISPSSRHKNKTANWGSGCRNQGLVGVLADVNVTISLAGILWVSLLCSSSSSAMFVKHTCTILGVVCGC